MKAASYPPMPVPPATAGANWLELSKKSLPPEEEPEPADTPPAATDDWSLVRAPDGESGLGAHAAPPYGDSR